jgi:putative oxidoreductase
MPKGNFLTAPYRLLVKLANYLPSPFLLAIRLWWGYQTMIAGYGHLTHIQSTIGHFRDDFHIPMPVFNAYLSGCSELIFGALLLLGLASRLAALALTINFSVAILSSQGMIAEAFAKPGFGNTISGLIHLIPNTIKDINQYPDAYKKDTALPFLLTSLLVLIFGPGLFSIDALLKRTVFGKSKA